MAVPESEGVGSSPHPARPMPKATQSTAKNPNDRSGMSMPLMRVFR